MTKARLMIALVCLPFFVMAIWSKEESPRPGVLDSLIFWKTEAQRMDEHTAGVVSSVAYNHAVVYRDEDPRIQYVASKPAAIAQIRQTVTALDAANAELVAWEQQVKPLLRSKEGLSITWSPEYVAAADYIFYGKNLPDKSLIEEPLLGLVPYIHEVRKMTGMQTAPLIDYKPLKLDEIRKTAYEIRDLYRLYREAMFEYVSASVGKSPTDYGSLAAAIQVFRQQKAGATVLKQLSE